MKVPLCTVQHKLMISFLRLYFACSLQMCQISYCESGVSSTKGTISRIIVCSRSRMTIYITLPRTLLSLNNTQSLPVLSAQLMASSKRVSLNDKLVAEKLVVSLVCSLYFGIRTYTRNLLGRGHVA